MMQASAARPVAGGMAIMPSRFSRAMVPCTCARQKDSDLVVPQHRHPNCGQDRAACDGQDRAACGTANSLRSCTCAMVPCTAFRF